MPSDLSDDYEIPYPKSVITGWMAERDALRVRLGKATELLACWQALFGDDDEEKSEGFMNETRAFLGDGAP